MNPVEIQWSIFFLVAVSGATYTAALPVDAWGIFFLSGLIAVSGRVVDRAQDLADVRDNKPVKGFFRIEVEILRLKNDFGVENNGLPCDGPLGKCDQKITAFIDTERPNHDFGGDSVPYNYRHFATLLTAKGVDSSKVQKTISRDVCGQSIRKINVRVRVEDIDKMRNDDKIENFNCFTHGLDAFATTEAKAEWSPEQVCGGLDSKEAKIWFKYRCYFIDAKSCRPSSTDRSMLDRLFF